MNVICKCDHPRTPATLVEATVWGLPVQIHTTCHAEYAEQIRQRDAEEVAKGERYQHYKGDIYQVVCYAKNEADGKIMVVYQSEKTHETFVQPYDRFHEVFSGDEGTSFARFLKIT